jgi:hypothetical protein
MPVWSIHQTVIAAWWSIEESDQGFEPLLGMAELLTAIAWRKTLAPSFVGAYCTTPIATSFTS